MAEICSHAESGTSDQNGNMDRPRNKPSKIRRTASPVGRRLPPESPESSRSDELVAPGYENLGHGGRLSSMARPNRAVFQRTSAVSITRTGCEMGTACKDPSALAKCSESAASTRSRERAAGKRGTRDMSAPIGANRPRLREAARPALLPFRWVRPGPSAGKWKQTNFHHKDTKAQSKALQAGKQRNLNSLVPSCLCGETSVPSALRRRLRQLALGRHDEWLAVVARQHGVRRRS